MAYEFLEWIVFGNTVESLLNALLIFFIALFVLKIFKFIVLKRLKSIAKKSKTEWDDFFILALDSVHWPFYILISLWVSLKRIIVLPVINLIMIYLLNIVAIYYIVKVLTHGITKITKSFLKEGDNEDSGSIQLFGNISKGILWALALLLVLSNLGYDISTLIAGLGVGGIAIAFALQNILSDIFASFSIHFDKPFSVGDYIVIGADMGVVTKIGIKSTRIKTLQGQELIVSNKELTSTRINNYKKMQKRRIAFNLGVTYQTSTEQLKKIPGWITEIIEKNEQAEPSRVHFNEFADSALIFNIIYLMKVSDYAVYMDTQQEINFAIKQKFEDEGIEFAYPTQTIILDK